MKFLILLILVLIQTAAHGSVTVVVNGSNHTIPQTNERGWGNAVTAWIQAITSYTLQPTGGTFTLAADIDFGASYGLKAPYYLTRVTNPSTVGLLRMAKTDSVGWRNNANGANLLLKVDPSDNLAFDGIAIANVSGAQTLTNKTIDASSNTISNISNSNVSSSAAIALSKLATTTASRAVVTDVSGALGVSMATATEISYISGASSNVQDQLNARVISGSTTPASLITGQVSAVHGGTGLSAYGSSDKILGMNNAGSALEYKTLTAGTGVTITSSAGAVTLAVTSPVVATIGGTNQTTYAAGDILYASAANTLSKLPAGVSGTVLTMGQPGGVSTPSWIAGGTGSGLKNYILNPDAEASNTGWATYLDAAGTSPVDGTGGSPNADFTFARSTSTPLRGSGSFLLTHTSNNRQGTGVSYDFTIDVADKAKILNVSFDYNVASGTLADADLSVWIYDVTNSLLIQPAPVSMPNAVGPAKWSGSFQTASNSTSYRLILHDSTTTATAYTVQFDNVVVGPQTNSIGGSVGDWVSFTPTGTWSTNTTYTGYWRRVGDSLEFRIRLALAGAPTSASLAVNYLPSGLTADTTKLLGTTAPKIQALGLAKSAGNSYGVVGGYTSATQIGVYLYDTAGSYAGAGNLITQAVPATFASGDSVELTGTVPIVGWGSSQVLSSETDTRVVASRYVSSGTQTITTGAAVKLSFQTKTFDTHGAFDNATNYRYTIPFPGKYRITAYNYWNVSMTGASDVQLLAYKNGSSLTVLDRGVGTANMSQRGSDETDLVAGDYIEIFTAQNSGGSLATSNCYFVIEKISGPSQIAASESVSVVYQSTAVTSYANGPTTYVLPTKIKDTHGAFASNVFTAPVSGLYSVNFQSQFGFTPTQGSYITVYAAQAGSQTKNWTLGSLVTASTNNVNGYGVGGMANIPMLAGDTITIKIQTNQSANVVEYVTSPFNGATLSISRVGN